MQGLNKQPLNCQFTRIEKDQSNITITLDFCGLFMENNYLVIDCQIMGCTNTFKGNRYSNCIRILRQQPCGNMMYMDGVIMSGRSGWSRIIIIILFLHTLKFYL